MPFSWKRQDFVDHLERTLIPDLVESGSYAMAEDFKTAVAFINQPDADEVDIDEEFDEEEDEDDE